MSKKKDLLGGDWVSFELLGTCEVNPLLWYKAEAKRPRDGRFPIDSIMSFEQSFFEFITRPNRHFKAEQLVECYREITAVERRTPLRAVLSSDPRIEHRLIFPLKNAKVAFMTGNYLGTIALCGLISEMISMLLFELNEPELDPASVRAAFAAIKAQRSFERLYQSQRLRVLKALKLVTPRQVKWFATVAEIRRRNLHFFRPDGGSKLEALKVYEAAVGLVYTVTREKGKRGKLASNPLLVEMLRRQGRTTKWVRKPASQPE